MQTQEAAVANTGTIFAESDPLVLIAYFLAFGIWTTASGNDFISSTWKTVRETRRRGKLHVGCVFIPMIYISVYIYFQHKNQDYKEMGAALLALAFAVLHLVRTFMGLWQLHMFKQWTMSSIRSMESLGYETHLLDNNPEGAEDSDIDEEGDDHEGDDEEANDRGEHDNGGPGDSTIVHVLGKRMSSFTQMILSRTFSYKEQGRIEQLADDVLVNDTLIDNRLSEVPTVCFLRLLPDSERKIVKQTKRVLARLWLLFRYRFANSLLVVRALLSLTLMRAPQVPNAESGPCLIPRHPESVWLRWATTLVAQVGWILHEKYHVDPGPDAGYEEHRNHFAEQILLSAAMHTQRTGSTENGSSRNTSNNSSRAKERTSMLGILSYHDWYNYPKLCNGQLCKQEFLKRACKTGNGLPYHVPHLNAVERRGRSKQYGYGNFASELRRAREALPPKIETRVEDFDVDRLEWLAVFVSIENWTPWILQREEEGLVESSTDNDSDDSMSRENLKSSDIEDAEPGNDIPIENLKKQLGFVPSFFQGGPRRRFLQSNLWGNRNVLEISCHIDNWMALWTGDQSEYTVDHFPWLNRKMNLENVVSDKQQDGNESNSAASPEFVEENATFEKCKTYCQMVTLHPEYCHFEKTTTFLGCNMEMLRSSLAKWTAAHGDCNEQSWKPPLFYNEGDKSLDLDRFEGTCDFTSCIRSLRGVSDMAKRFVKMRALWELQNHFQNHILENGAAPNSAEAIALCILSFPAVSMEVRAKENISRAPEVIQGSQECSVDMQHENGKLFRVQNHEYAIRANCGPQDLQVILSFEAMEENSNVWLRTHLRKIEERHVVYFDWEAWRNAFYARLEACRKWKEKLGFPNFSLTPSTQSIASGIRDVVGPRTSSNLRIGTGNALHVWNGWLPHCSSICVYELTTDGLIQEAREVAGISFPVSLSEDMRISVDILQEIWVSVSYAEAKGESLKRATLQAEELLKYGSRPSGQEIAQDALVEVESLLAKGKLSLALLVLESRAIKQRDISALKKAMSILLGDGRKSIERGIKILERFYGCGKQDPGDESELRQDIASFCDNEDHVTTVTSLFEQAFKASKYKREVAKRYHLFLLVVMSYGRRGTREKAFSVLLRSIACRQYASDICDAVSLTMDLCNALSHQDRDEFAALSLGFSNIGKEADRAWKEGARTERLSRLMAFGGEAKHNLATAIDAAAEAEQGLSFLEALGLSRDRGLGLFEEAVQEREDRRG